MNTTIATLERPVSGFETQEQDTCHTAWLQAEIAARLENPGRLIPHAEIERRMAERLDSLRKRKAA